jgi:hypothetical protein
MPNDFWFRLSTYLALALSCVCLGYAEWELLPEVTVFAALVIAMLVAAFFLDRKFELGLGKANLLGLGIGIVAALWMVYHVARPHRSGPMAELGWPTNLLPVVAPVLMVLIPAKLLRPKHVGDWWGMHGVALAAVALASAMEDNGIFIGLFILYAVTAGWSLVLFFYRRSGGVLPPVPNRPFVPAPQVLATNPADRGPKWLFAHTALWLGVATAIALPLFFILPRPSGAAWVMTKNKYEIGQSSEPKVDLNKTGELVATDEIAYVLHATDRNQARLVELPIEQLWRARSLTEYNRGAWSRGTYLPSLNIWDLDGTLGASVNPDEFGPDGYVIEFHPKEKEIFPVLASPVWWSANKTPAYWLNTGAPWTAGADGSFIGLQSHKLLPYRQVCKPPTPDGLGKPFELKGLLDPSPLIRMLNDVPRVRAYANTLLEQFVQQGKIPAEAVRKPDDPLGRTDPRYHEPIARAFCSFLADSGEFAYTTTLVKIDPKADVTEDFLFNSKSGNCELFATALVLMLRFVDVPAQYVTGYKGWELDDDGNLIIRRGMAHAWAEVLISRPPPPGFGFRDPNPGPQPRVWYWLSLDPTSGSVSATSTTSKTWYDRLIAFINEYFISYDKEKQKKAIEFVVRWGQRIGPVLGALIVLTLLGRWLRQRWKRHQAEVAAAKFPGPEWYGEFLTRMAQLGCVPAVGETPREFGNRVSMTLEAMNHSAVDVPAFLVSKLYRVRYAGVPLTADEEALIQTALKRLEPTAAPSGGKP